MASSRRPRTPQDAPDRGANPTTRLRARAAADTLPALEAAIVEEASPAHDTRPWHARTTTHLPRTKKPRSATKLPASTQQVQRARKPLAVETVGDAAVRLAGRIPLGEVPRPEGPRLAKTLKALTSLERAVLVSADGCRAVRAIIAEVDEPAERVFATLIRLERLGLLGF
jgi:hypothetical protein